MLKNMQFFRSKYCYGDGTYIAMLTEDGESWCDVTVNLDEYGLHPEDENHIYIPIYKMDDETLDYIKSHLVDTVINTVPIGFGSGLYVKLVDNWKDLAPES